MTVSLIFHVFGVPAPQGSKRHLGNGVMVESSALVAPWRREVADAATAAILAQGWSTATSAVVVRLVFQLRRPTTAPKRRKWPDRKPDLDKLIRSTLDGLDQALVYEDDARVVGLRVGKVYAQPGQQTGCDITVRVLA